MYMMEGIAETDGRRNGSSEGFAKAATVRPSTWGVKQCAWSDDV